MESSTSDSRIPQAPALAGERLAFTGTLASMTHKEAHVRVVDWGGVAAEHLSRQTTMLVVGEEGWPLEDDGNPSVKLQQAQRLQVEGVDLRVVRESEWLGFVGLDSRRAEIHKLCTPAMLSQMLGISVHKIRRWERLGLIQAVSHVCRLPYFDFQEAASARRLAELVDAGVPIKEIQRSLVRLESVVEVGTRPLAQLEILGIDRHLLYRDKQGRLKTGDGQMLFEFESLSPAELFEPESLVLPAEQPSNRSDWSAQDWFERGRRLADEGNGESAIEAFRMSLMQDFEDPEVHFHLAEALYRQGNTSGALERYHVAAELDHNFLEAWTQIGCILAESGELAAAVEAFDIALDLHPDYPDAHLHKAETLHQSGRTNEAVVHWRKYLEFDQTGPWAQAARERLEEMPRV